MLTVRCRACAVGRCVRHSFRCNLRQELSAICITAHWSFLPRPAARHGCTTVQCYLLIVLQYYTRDPRAPVYTGAAKFKLFQTLATSFIWRHGWISANPFVIESALCVEDGNTVLVSPGGVGRTRCSLITPEVRFPVGGCCSPYAIRILPRFAVYNTVAVAICYRSCLSIYERTSIVHASPPSSWALLCGPLLHAHEMRIVLAKSGYLPSSSAFRRFSRRRPYPY